MYRTSHQEMNCVEPHLGSPPAVLCTLYALVRVILTSTLEGIIFISPAFQIRKQKVREIKELALI